MVAHNMKAIGGGYTEATCEKCGEKFIFAAGDDIFVRVEHGDTWPLCSKCYNGPRADPSKVARRRQEIAGEIDDQ